MSSVSFLQSPVAGVDDGVCISDVVAGNFLHALVVPVHGQT